MSLFTILLAGDLAITDRLAAQVAGTRVIAADGGMRHARALGLTPELWVGDFDSAPDALLDQWQGIERQPYPRAKNATDGEIAVDTAIARGATSLVIAGALGGERTDHAVMHLLLALSLTERGIPTLLTTGEEEAQAHLGGQMQIDLPKGALFSILPFSALSGLTIEGARYPLDRAEIDSGSSRTVSNVAEGPVTITLQSGRAMVIARPADMSGG
ncbi:thiamine diphosphokinase [Rhizobium sp. C1]|uniref:thiamine diphosphokinase n=1 Tax=Rhizobium sp. C1 TaxID=1349799 RepID=UPI001E590BFD|nr:thiamine diphosphokinase [Rhizobium sp. C1]MCD2178435.1 thiamine diphosphokinase [Rhizobium sp. C1]